MSARQFHNALRIMRNLEGFDMQSAGVIDENWGTNEASSRDQLSAFYADPFGEALRMPDANFDRLYALIESRQPKREEPTADERMAARNVELSEQNERMAEALRPLIPAYRAYVETMQNFVVEGETLADRRASEEERREYASENAWESLTKISFEQLAAANAALPTPA